MAPGRRGCFWREAGAAVLAARPRRPLRATVAAVPRPRTERGLRARLCAARRPFSSAGAERVLAVADAEAVLVVESAESLLVLAGAAATLVVGGRRRGCARRRRRRGRAHRGERRVPARPCRCGGHAGRRRTTPRPCPPSSAQRPPSRWLTQRPNWLSTASRPCRRRPRGPVPPWRCQQRPFWGAVFISKGPWSKRGLTLVRAARTLDTGGAGPAHRVMDVTRPMVRCHD